MALDIVSWTYEAFEKDLFVAAEAPMCRLDNGFNKNDPMAMMASPRRSAYRLYVSFDPINVLQILFRFHLADGRDAKYGVTKASSVGQVFVTIDVGYGSRGIGEITILGSSPNEEKDCFLTAVKTPPMRKSSY
jgi:hypothetical protein